MKLSSETMYRAYIEAVYFTDTGDSDQPGPDAELSDAFKCQARNACSSFAYAIESLHGSNGGHYFELGSSEQFGHDLWLTREGHGAGFWDRRDLYGGVAADVYTAIALAMGSHSSEFNES